MNLFENSQSDKITNFRSVAGILLILAGAMLFLDRYLKTGWLSLMILPSTGLLFYIWGIRQRHVGMIIAGGLLSSTGLGMMAAWGSALHFNTSGVLDLNAIPHGLITQIGLLSLYTGLGWGLIVITTVTAASRPTWWALVPGGILGGLGYCLLYTPLRWVDFVFYLALGTGLPLLIWGLISRLLGLVIPGCLLVGIGLGIFNAWKNPAEGNGLTQTGVMLVWFGAGWVLITMCSRWLRPGYVWWPLIPGGIIAVVGMGLYIGGDPSRALGFIGNTGSIALVIFGLYLLLMRKGIHH